MAALHHPRIQTQAKNWIVFYFCRLVQVLSHENLDFFLREKKKSVYQAGFHIHITTVKISSVEPALIGKNKLRRFLAISNGFHRDYIANYRRSGP